jgi:curved DNA-binding protein CbpA
MLDPYDILGIPPNSDWKSVKRAYKHMLNQTHPDKMGNAKYFMMVHEAYQQLEKTYNSKRRFKDVPQQSTTYTPETEYSQIPKMKDFSNSKFNQYFADNKLSHSDYMDQGYGNRMTQSLSYQEEHSDLMKNKINIPKKSVVVYKEPDPLVSSSRLLDNCYQLGVDKVNDFTCQQGTDVIHAFSEQPELIDTVQRYRNLDDLSNSRSTQNFTLSQEEQQRLQYQEQDRARLEQYRLQRMRQHDSALSSRYTELHRQLRM